MIRLYFLRRGPYKIHFCQWERMIIYGSDNNDDNDDNDDDDDIDVHVVDDGDDDAKEVTQSSTSLPRGNQVDGLPRVCSLVHRAKIWRSSTSRNP